MVMGAPGSSYWTGSVLVYNMTSKVFAAYVDDDNTVLYGSYLGKIGNSLFGLKHHLHSITRIKSRYI